MSVTPSMLEMARQTTKQTRRRITDEGDAFSTFRFTLQAGGANQCLNDTDTDADTAQIDIIHDSRYSRSEHSCRYTPSLSDEVDQQTEFFSPGVITQSQAQSIETVDDVCDLYDNTVLSTPHADMTAMSVPMHLTAEFGPTVAQSLLLNASLTSTIRSRVIAASMVSIANRQAWKSRLDAEIKAIDSAGAIVDEILAILIRIRETVPGTRSSAGCRQTCQHLNFLMSQVDDAITSRQVVIEQHCRILGSTHGMVSETLYRDCSHTRPVFQALATTKQMLQRTRTKIAKTEQTARS